MNNGKYKGPPLTLETINATSVKKFYPFEPSFTGCRLRLMINVSDFGLDASLSEITSSSFKPSGFFPEK